MNNKFSEWHVSLRKVNIYALKKTLTENLDKSAQNNFLLHLGSNLKRRIFLFSTEIYHQSSKVYVLTGRAGRGGERSELRRLEGRGEGKSTSGKNL